MGFEVGGFLDRLETDYNVISKVRPYMSGENSRNVRYVISDNFLNFWFRFVYKYRSAVEIGNMEYVRNKIFNDYETYSRHVLEKYFRQNTVNQDFTILLQIIGRKGPKDNPARITRLTSLQSTKTTDILLSVNANGTATDLTGKLTQKAAKIINHHKLFTYEIIGVSIDDM